MATKKGASSSAEVRRLRNAAACSSSQSDCGRLGSRCHRRRRRHRALLRPGRSDSDDADRSGCSWRQRRRPSQCTTAEANLAAACNAKPPDATPSQCTRRRLRQKRGSTAPERRQSLQRRCCLQQHLGDQPKQQHFIASCPDQQQQQQQQQQQDNNCRRAQIFASSATNLFETRSFRMRNSGNEVGQDYALSLPTTRHEQYRIDEQNRPILIGQELANLAGQQQQQRIVTVARNTNRWNEATTKAVIRKHMDQLEMCNKANGGTSALAGGADLLEDQMAVMRLRSRMIPMSWSKHCESPDCIISPNQLSVLFHPNQASSTAVCLANEPLKRTGCSYYWEIRVLEKAYGTSVMFGLCTKAQILHKNEYCNLIGLDQNGWSLSHKGLAWHAGYKRPYAAPFPASSSVTVGIEFNTLSGQLSYYMNGRNLGVAFFGLNEVQDDLYPCVGSTAKNTVFLLLGAYCGQETLVDRSCFKILSHSSDHAKLFEYLKNNYRLPGQLAELLKRSSSAWQRDDNNSDERMDDNNEIGALKSAFASQQQPRLEPPLIADVHLQYAD